MTILLANNAASLTAALATYNSTITVEAEYGQDLVEGTLATLAHHGSRAGNPAPCLAETRDLGAEAIGLSHLDLDALGGVLAVTGQKAEGYESFWALAAFVDINGPHKLSLAGATAEDIRRLQAFWAYAQAHRVLAPRDGSALDVTEVVMTYADVLARILADDAELLAAGDAFAAAQTALDEASFVREQDGVILRTADQFVNHLYVHGKTVGKAVVAYNQKTCAITLSLADPIPGFSCATFMQGIFGPEAGGHAGIAGTPRGAEFAMDDAERVFRKLAEHFA